MLTNLGNIVTLVAPHKVRAGEGVVVGSIFGVVAHDADNGTHVDTQMVGIFDLPKVQAETWAQGDLVYWDNANKEATTTANGKTKIGVAILPADNTKNVGQVRLNGTF